MNIAFTSTYRVPFKQPGKGVKPTKKDALKDLAVDKYDGLAPKHRQGNVKFSVRKELDKQVEKELKQLGFKTYKKVPIHNVPKAELVDALEYEGKFAKLKAKHIEQGLIEA